MNRYRENILNILRILGKDLCSYKLITDKNGNTIEIRKIKKVKIRKIKWKEIILRNGKRQYPQKGRFWKEEYP